MASGTWNVDCTTGYGGSVSDTRYQVQFDWHQSYIKGGSSSTVTVNAKIVCTTFKYAVNASWFKDGVDNNITISAGSKTIGTWAGASRLTETALTYQGQVLWSGSTSFTMSTVAASSFSISITGGLFVNTSSYGQSFRIPTTSSTQYTDAIPQKRTVYISPATGTWITVTQNGSPIYDSASVYDGDSLYVTAGANEGYGLSSLKNGSTEINSGTTITVSGNITLSTTAYVYSYSLTIRAATGTSISVYRSSSPKQGASAGYLANGGTIYHSDVLKISAGAEAGWEVTSLTVNGNAFTSGNTHTVSGSVSVATTGKQLGLAYIGDGSTNAKYLVYIGNGSGYDMYIPYIGDGTKWNLLS